MKKNQEDIKSNEKDMDRDRLETQRKQKGMLKDMTMKQTEERTKRNATGMIRDARGMKRT